MADKMLVVGTVFLLLGIACALPGKFRDDPPRWPQTYSVKGILELPYAEIKEPFAGYFDAGNKRSRVDYYGGLVMTFQRGDQGDHGMSYKVAPMTTYTVTNQITCFKVPGFQSAPVDPQGLLPDLTFFEKSDKQEFAGQMCDVWKNVTIVGKKKNVYTMWITTDTQQPVQYEMMGFDSLIGSHFDKYILKYYDYNTDVLPSTVFETPAGLTCGDFPGPGSGEARILTNPMAEFVSNNDDHVHEMFQKFKDTHSPVYSHEKEHAQRLHNFRQNLRFIHSKNRKGLSYKLAVNHLADRSRAELKARNGYRHTPGDHGALLFDRRNFTVQAPDSMDWRLLGAVTPVKDQGVCGSCWSFGTAETIEGAHFLKTGNLVRLSQQELVDCSWGEGNNGCDGGEDFRSYNWIMNNGGLSSEEQYGQYLAVDGNCHSGDVTPVAKLTGYVNVTSGNLEALKFAIAQHGPISVAIDASHLSLSFYANGVYYEPDCDVSHLSLLFYTNGVYYEPDCGKLTLKFANAQYGPISVAINISHQSLFYADGVYYEPNCGNQPDQLDHAVLAVGYGQLNGQDYWLVKNSWSTYWGMDGYVLMAQKDNNCGVATAPTFVKM